MALAAAAPAAEAVTDTSVFLAVSSKDVTEAPTSSASAASAAVPVAAPATGWTVFPTSSVGRAARVPSSADKTAALTAAPSTGDTAAPDASVEKAARQLTLKKVICWNGVIGRGSGGGTVDRRYCCPSCVGGEGDLKAHVQSWVL